ncbi:hypothetical protein Y032_0119g829 [Ancylostoma ceylanicum]|uniref:Uncharacterized protein n=1 Tax=Ancylostoma ceylanicum TaxID=53326 RepID=A0A016TB64_9BILA|nr:hypothetical protein Y032_0119g829 [Ancylostoma ceylanicum]
MDQISFEVLSCSRNVSKWISLAFESGIRSAHQCKTALRLARGFRVSKIGSSLARGFRARMLCSSLERVVGIGGCSLGGTAQSFARNSKPRIAD